MEYRFPKACFVNTNHLIEQIHHLRSELIEIEEEYDKSEMSLDSCALAIEVLDLLHSCETTLRILELDFCIDIDDMFDHVVAKNKARGYYKEG